MRDRIARGVSVSVGPQRRQPMRAREYREQRLQTREKTSTINFAAFAHPQHWRRREDADSSIAVAIASVTKFAAVCRTAGAVQNTASFVSGSSVRRQCGRYETHTSTAPAKAPIICAPTYPATFSHAKLPIVASAIVTAGLRCAPLMRPTE